MTAVEKAFFALSILVPTVGHFFARTDPVFFDRVYCGEDEFFETMTAVWLLLCSMICLRSFFKNKNRTRAFSVVTLLMAVMFFFGAGEELSWGQRIFHWKTPDILEKYNHQGETNLHNIKIGEFKVNKIIFGQLLSLGLVFFYLVLPLLYRFENRTRRWVTELKIPIAKNWHIIAVILATVIATAIPHSRKWELVEFCGCMIIFAIFWKPFNSDIRS